MILGHADADCRAQEPPRFAARHAFNPPSGSTCRFPRPEELPASGRMSRGVSRSSATSSVSWRTGPALGAIDEVMDDDELIAALAAGDDTALREQIGRHAPWLAAPLRTALPPPDVED